MYLYSYIQREFIKLLLYQLIYNKNINELIVSIDIE
jgi:hypothetical protein